MHVASTTLFEGPAPSYQEFYDHIESRLHLVPRFRQKLRFVPVRPGPPGVGRRPSLQPRLPRAPHGPARAGIRGAAAHTRRPRVLPAPRPLQAALGDVAGGGRSRATASRSSARPTTAWSTASRAWTSPPSSSTPSRSRPTYPHRSRGRRGPEPERRRAARRGAGRARDQPRAEMVRGARARLRGPPGRPAAPWSDAVDGRRGVRPRRHGRPGLAVQRRDRPLPALRRGARRPRPTSSRSRTRSAAPSTTSCSRRSPARSGGTCAPAGTRRDELELRAMVPISVRAADEHGDLGNRVSSFMAPLPVWWRTRPSACSLVSATMGDLKESKQAVGRDPDDPAPGLRPADDRRPGGTPAVAPAVLQPRRHQRARPAVPPVPARPPDGVDVPDGAAGQAARRSASGS